MNNILAIIAVLSIVAVILSSIALAQTSEPTRVSSFPQNNTTAQSLSQAQAMAPVMLHQSDFDQGTFRIKKAGHYKLAENVSFNPDLDNLASYRASHPAYILGFFAAITIECDDVVLDLGGFTLSQHPEHILKQRFFSVIELASAPFDNQGPANFGSSIVSAKNVKVCHGTVGANSHHGLHGNGNHSVVLEDIHFRDFEIAGPHLNGVTGLVVRNVEIGPTKTNVSTNAMFSQAIFEKKAMLDADPSLLTETVDLVNSSGTAVETLTGQQVLDNLQAALDDPVGAFPNPSGMADGNVYGMVINSHGVAVDAFPTELGPANAISEFCTLENVHIHDINSKPVEVPALECEHNSVPFGGVVAKGNRGAVFRLNQDASGHYVPNPLSNMQLFLAKHTTSTSIGSHIMEWAGQLASGFEQSMMDASQNCTFIGNSDSMAHSMKGSIGLFMAQSRNVVLHNVTIDGVSNLSDASTVDQPTYALLGGAARGVAMAGCEQVDLGNLVVSNITASNGASTNIHTV